MFEFLKLDCVALSFEVSFSGGSVAKNPPANQETQVQSLGREDPLEKEMAAYSNIFVWEIPWTEEPVDCSPWGHKRVGHNFVTKQQSFEVDSNTMFIALVYY